MGRNRMEKTAISRSLYLAVAATVAALAGCSAPEPPPFDPLSLQRGERELARELEPHMMRPLPTTLESPYLSRRGDQTVVVAPTTRTISPTTGMTITADNSM